MKCPRCCGEGIITFSKTDKNGYFNDAFFMKECPACHGIGKVSQTNEEWFCGLSTQEKAKRIINIAVNSDCDYRTIVEWLKETHK